MASFRGTLQGNGGEISRLANHNVTISASTWETSVNVTASFSPKYKWIGRRGRVYVEEEKTYEIRLVNLNNNSHSVSIHITEEEIMNLTRNWGYGVQERLDRGLRLTLGDIVEGGDYRWNQNYGNYDRRNHNNNLWRPSWMPKQLTLMENYTEEPPNTNLESMLITKQ
jgi:hypothetical protein